MIASPPGRFGRIGRRGAAGPAALHPSGTARALFLDVAADRGDPLPPSLWGRLLARDVDPGTLLGAWEVSRWIPGAFDDRPALAGLMVALGQTVATGGSYLSLASDAGPGRTGLADRLTRLGFDGGERDAIVSLANGLARGGTSPALAALFGAPGAGAPFVVSRDALYPETLWSFEERVAASLGARLARALPPLGEADDEPLAAVSMGADGSSLGAEQMAAVRACLTQPLTLVTGGPGTGKTSTIVALLRASFRRGLTADQVAIAAPTGRAAQRIAVSLRATPPDVNGGAVAVSTLHRMLGIPAVRRPRLDLEAPEFHAGWRLPHRLVIVDEASMIDLFLMSDLLAAVADDARLVLVGDADQLPSVRLGAVFRELCGALPELTCRLTTSYRMNPDDAAGAAILGVASGLGAALDPTAIPSRPRARELTFSGIEHLPRAGLSGLVDRWLEELLGGDAAVAGLARFRFSPDEQGLLAPGPGLEELGEALRRHARVRLLCVTRTADAVAGADALNGLLHDRLLATSAAADAWNGDNSPPVFLPGEPVTILRNDHARGLWNGDQGVVIRTSTEGREELGVAFPRGDGIVVHALGELTDNVGLGFALTVHKAQGSEYDRVALILPSGDGPLLTREILYTALTRARHGVVIVGNLALFTLGASRKLERASGLGERLARGRPAP